LERNSTNCCANFTGEVQLNPFPAG